jgi:putative membrane protein
MKREQLHWFSLTLRVKGSVIPSILNRVVWCGLFAVLISVVYFLKVPVSQPVLGTVIPSIVLGLLLVFRTNTAYERYWEGRRLWGGIVINSLNLARQIWVSVEEVSPEDRAKKISVLRLLVAFAVATKLHLRLEPVNAELEELLSPSQYFKLKTMNHPPLEIAFLIGDYLQQQSNRQTLNPYQLPTLQGLLNDMVGSTIGCERILRTPMPLAYAIHLKQLLLLYCLLLPFQLVAQLGWLTGPIVALVSFTLFGIEEIGIEIENPFGYDANDLPLDAICANIRRNVEDLMNQTPGGEEYTKENLQI